MNPADERRVREIVDEELEARDGDGAVEADDSEVASLRGTLGNVSSQLSQLRERVDELEGSDDGED